MDSLTRRVVAWTAAAALATGPLGADAADLRGFRGVPWGAGVAELGASQPAKPEEGLRCHRRERENLLYGDAPLTEVRFCFREDALVMVVLDAQVGPQALRAEFEAMYGPPRVSAASYALWGDASSRARVEIFAAAPGARTSSMRMVANEAAR
jgi:hypothetical protein